MKKLMLLFAAAGMTLTACDNSGSNQAQSTQTAPVASEPAPDVDPEVIVTINGGDDMKFDLREIRVRPGQLVKLTLNHTGNQGKEAMGHNFVLLKQGVDLNQFATDAITAKEHDYIPPGSEDKIIVHTKMIGGGESDTIEFPAPEPGSYYFLCSFPGHASMMKGTFIVE